MRWMEYKLRSYSTARMAIKDFSFFPPRNCPLLCLDSLRTLLVAIPFLRPPAAQPSPPLCAREKDGLSRVSARAPSLASEICTVIAPTAEDGGKGPAEQQLTFSFYVVVFFLRTRNHLVSNLQRPPPLRPVA